tara:strand:- start:1440 stop:4379 length:2940 start_codon:yes stop_codon:yes gene_type:complete
MTKPLNDVQLKQYKLLIIVLGLVFFCFSIAAALFFQKLLLPNMITMLAPGATLTVDSAYYDSVAVGMAEQIKLHGWSSWSLFPSIYTSANISILAALYAVFGYDPTLAIPLNALFHAFGGILIFMIAVELSSNYIVGICSGVVASLIFILFPSALNWYGQLLKDGYSIAAVLAVLLIWIKGINTSANTARSFYLVILGTLALCFLVAIRPYFFKLTLLVAFITLFVMIIWRLVFKNKNSWVFFLYVLLTFIPVQAFLNSTGGLASAGEGYARWDASHEAGFVPKTIERQKALKSALAWNWQPSNWLPSTIDQQMASVAKTRVGLIIFGIRMEADSLVDINKTPNNVTGVMMHLPRAFQVALLAPFPTTWVDKISATRILATTEMIVIYICLFGLIPLLVFNRNPQVFFVFCFSAFFLVVYGFISTNIGTLYRIRYGFELIMVMLGVIGWVSFLDKKGILHRCLVKFKEKIRPVTTVALRSDDKKSNLNRKSVIGSGAVVSLLTLVGFLGFFLRDILMAHQFGFGKDLDAFFLALLIPMFFVTVFCAPFGAASVPFLNTISGKVSSIKLGQITSHIVAIILVAMFFVSIAIYFSNPTIFASLKIIEQGVTGNENLPTLLVLALVILIFSGVIILGNAVLMAKERLIAPSAAQVVVPFIAILALLFFGPSYGVAAVMAGMVIGQILNLVIVHLLLKKHSVGLTPKYRPALNKDLSGLRALYLPLLASAFFAGVLLPIDTMLASMLDDGSVSIFNLGMKIVLFISGLLGAVVSNVMLPYFSSIVEKNNQNLVKKELSFFMLVATFISIPVSVIFYISAENVVGLVFYSNTFSEGDLTAIKSVMQYSVVQIPFFICNILLLKYATATRHLSVITLSAFVGLLLNVGLSLALMPVMGVSGIALATSLAMMTSSVLILIMLSFYGHISFVDMMLVLLNWIIFLTLIVALHFQSVPSVVMSIFSYAALLFAYAKWANVNGDVYEFA